MLEREVARFESAGDVRTLAIVEGEDGVVEVRERLSGPSALVAYGEEEHGLRVLFAPGEVEGMLRAVGTAGAPELAAYLADEKNGVVGLMDLCDACGVAYTFVGIGPASGVQCRPAM